jgi:hypothetical protein
MNSAFQVPLNFGASGWGIGALRTFHLEVLTHQIG